MIVGFRCRTKHACVSLTLLAIDSDTPVCRPFASVKQHGLGRPSSLPVSCTASSESRGMGKV